MSDPGTMTAEEWLLADGTGGFAMGSDGGPATRRYHAWLVAAADPPLDRHVLWRGAAEWWEPGDGGPRRDATCLQFAAPDERTPDAPVGPRPGPAWRSEDGRAVAWRTSLPELTIDRRLHLGEAAARLEWSIAAGAAGEGRWCVRPFTPLAPFHGLTREGGPEPSIETIDGGVRLQTGPLAVDLTVEIDAGGFAVDPDWWRRFALEHERARGQDWITDAWSPGVLRVPVAAGETVRCAMTVSLRTPRRGRMIAAVPSAAPGAPAVSDRAKEDELVAAGRRLDVAAEAFVVRRGAGRSIIAGYPWFADWGRDALISLPGLLPPGERDEEAMQVLAALAAHRRDGLLPNCFHDEVGVNDHAADTGPWFLRTLAVYLAVPGGPERARPHGLPEAAADIVAAVEGGTRHGIRLDDDGLIVAGEPGGPAVTWMDAMRGGVSFTPRHGKAVEINALWIEGLRHLAEVDADAGRRSHYAALAERAAAGFGAFWWPERACLVDRLGARREDAPESPVDRPVHELRPNQLIAAACPRVPLTREQRSGIVSVCRRRLLTPFGLRTLEPGDPAYIGRYEGDLMQRDAAYHQGTVWPWLMGPFVDAMFLAAAPDHGAGTARAAAADLQPLLATLDTGCVGHLAEIFDGDAPHRPDGCPAQAWSVAEVRRVLRRIVTGA